MNAVPLCRPESHLSRRSLLRLAGGGLFLAPIARQLAAAEEAAGKTARPKSVILLWMEGAPSQLETFDPHPGKKIGGDVQAIKTSNPEIKISHLLPQVAEQMHRGALLRSVFGKEGDHARAIYNVKTGYRLNPALTHPSIGSVLCERSRVGAEIPRHISILPGGFPARGGFLGPEYDAFKVYDPDSRVPDVEKRVSPERYTRRINDLMDVAEAEFARGRLPQLERRRTLHRTATEAALTMMDSEQLQAFDVSQEDSATLKQFGDTPFGRGCLAAARLIEVGVRCVEVTLGGWDSHVNNHSLQASACETFDPALAGLLQLLTERELLEDTLVVCGGEFGRTPTINALGGRDHWPHGFSVFMAGCGIRPGALHGGTSPEPDLATEKPVEKNLHLPVSVADVHATILAALGLDHEHVLDSPIGRPMTLSEGKPIQAVLV